MYKHIYLKSKKKYNKIYFGGTIIHNILSNCFNIIFYRFIIYFLLLYLLILYTYEMFNNSSNQVSHHKK